MEREVKLDPEQPKLQLLAGIRILDPVLVPSGFAFSLQGHDKGSGGWYAAGSYIRDERKLELHFRESLGLVRYHIGDHSLDHESYMRFAGVYGQNQYPGFPREPLQSFAHLASDMSKYCSVFLTGDGKAFVGWAKQLKENPNLFKGVGPV